MENSLQMVIYLFSPFHIVNVNDQGFLRVFQQQPQVSVLIQALDSTLT